ncbi:MAG: NAD-dependent epimerase/dehydratase family protein [Candidatus Bathyarchaeota archaeon]|jgi:UDP-glucose 4-epimerase
MGTLVTGGAGFIGSHLVDHLMERGNHVRVFDNLSSGERHNLERWDGSQRFQFEEGDLLDPKGLPGILDGCEAVYHLAANPEVRSWLASPEEHFRQNVEATYNLLEAIRRVGGVELCVFASTSTVYGEPGVIPTPEDYAPLKPISHYGASKLASEALILSYASMYGFRCAIFRMANIVGPRSGHGVVYDFIEKLRADPSILEVLGDGTQSKSYLFIEDCVRGLVLGSKRATEGAEVLNISSDDRVNVLSIAEIVIDEMGLRDVKINLTGGVDGGRGWKGDVKLMQLDSSKLRRYGWKPKYSSSDAIRLTAQSLV